MTVKHKHHIQMMTIKRAKKRADFKNAKLQTLLTEIRVLDNGRFHSGGRGEKWHTLSRWEGRSEKRNIENVSNCRFLGGSWGSAQPEEHRKKIRVQLQDHGRIFVQHQDHRRIYVQPQDHRRIYVQLQGYRRIYVQLQDHRRICGSTRCLRSFNWIRLLPPT